MSSEGEQERLIKDWLEQKMKVLMESFPAPRNTNFQNLFDVSIERLQNAVLSYEPTWLLSSLAFDHLFAFECEAFLPEAMRRPSVEQHHLELLQILILSHPREKFGLMADPESTVALLTETCHYYLMQRINVAQEKHGNFGELVANSQAHTMAIRNFAYPQQIIDVIRHLYSPLESKIETARNFRAADIAQMLFSLVTLIEDRVSKEVDSTLAPVLILKSLAEVKGLSKENSLLMEAERALPLAIRKGWSIDMYHHVYLDWWKLRLADLMTLTASDLVKCYPGNLNIETSKDLLHKWSIGFGTHLPANHEHIMLANPIWDKPFIRLSDERYFLPIANLLIGSAPKLIWNAICGEENNIPIDIAARKAEFLEESLEKLFRASFAPAAVLVNAEWRDEMAQGETDIVVLLPPYAFLIEAKSGNIDTKAKRGAPKSLKESIKKLVVEPSEQSAAFIGWIKRNPGRQTVSTKDGQFTLNCSEFKHFIQLNVNLEDYCPQASNWQSLSDFGIVDENLKAVPTVSLTDLSCVFELLETQSEKLHYWKRRQELESVRITSDELGWLKLYLDNRINFKPTTDFLTLPLLPFYAQFLNAYFQRDETSKEVPKPKSSVPETILEAIRLAERERIPGWLDFSFSLLDLCNEQQAILSQLIEGVAAGNASQKFGEVKFDCILATDEDNADILFCVATTCSDSEAERLAKKLIYSQEVRSVYMFVNSTQNSISLVRVFNRE